METDVTYRERLLKLKIYLQNYGEGHISLSLRIVFLSRTGILSLQMSQSMIFLTNKGLFQRWRQCNQGLLLWDKYFWYNQYQHDSRKITRFFTSSIASMLLSYCLNFPETWIYINILIPISILNSLSTQLFPRNSFFLLFKRSIKKLVFQWKLLVKLWLKLLWS